MVASDITLLSTALSCTARGEGQVTVCIVTMATERVYTGIFISRSVLL